MGRFLRWWQGLVLALVVLAAAGGGAAWWLTRPPPVVDPLAAIRQKGAISVGVRAGAAPFSAIDANHNFVGYEPDVARELAFALGVPAHFVAVDGSDAIDFLERGVVDMVLMPRNAEAAGDSQIRTIEPGYFASGYNAITLREAALKSWDDLKGQAVCGLESNASAKQIVAELGGSFIGFADRNSALQALSAERCAALIGDEVGLAEALKADSDGHLAMAFDTIDISPWTVEVRAAAKDLGDAIAKEIVNDHRKGFFLDRASAWNLPQNPYLESMHAYYKR